jgi:hypothetical protein
MKGVCRPELGHHERRAHTRALRRWFRDLQDRFRYTHMLRGDWQRCVSTFLCQRVKPCGVFLDPPYADNSGSQRSKTYTHDTPQPSDEVNRWCQAKSDVRIVLCGYGTTHDNLLSLGWTRHSYVGPSGFSNTGGDSTKGQKHRLLETLWLSPACKQAQLSLI